MGKHKSSLPARPLTKCASHFQTLNIVISLTPQLTEAELDELANTRPTLTYGNPTRPAPVEFVPAHVAFDKKV